MATNEEKLASLLKDLQELGTYLHERGEKNRLLSLKFAEHAKEKSSDQAFDLNQSRMLDYQHSLFHEIGNLVDKLTRKYE